MEVPGDFRMSQVLVPTMHDVVAWIGTASPPPHATIDVLET